MHGAASHLICHDCSTIEPQHCCCCCCCCHLHLLQPIVSGSMRILHASMHHASHVLTFEWSYHCIRKLCRRGPQYCGGHWPGGASGIWTNQTLLVRLSAQLWWPPVPEMQPNKRQKKSSPPVVAIHDQADGSGLWAERVSKRCPAVIHRPPIELFKDSWSDTYLRDTVVGLLASDLLQDLACPPALKCI